MRGVPLGKRDYEGRLRTRPPWTVPAGYDKWPRSLPLFWMDRQSQDASPNSETTRESPILVQTTGTPPPSIPEPLSVSRPATIELRKYSPQPAADACIRVSDRRSDAGVGSTITYGFRAAHQGERAVREHRRVGPPSLPGRAEVLLQREAPGGPVEGMRRSSGRLPRLSCRARGPSDVAKRCDPSPGPESERTRVGFRTQQAPPWVHGNSARVARDHFRGGHRHRLLHVGTTSPRQQTANGCPFSQHGVRRGDTHRSDHRAATEWQIRNSRECPTWNGAASAASEPIPRSSAGRSRAVGSQPHIRPPGSLRRHGFRHPPRAQVATAGRDELLFRADCRSRAESGSAQPVHQGHFLATAAALATRSHVFLASHRDVAKRQEGRGDPSLCIRAALADRSL